MARKSESVAEPPAVEAPLTQRAYTLRLRGADPQDKSWRDALWATHEAINLGTKVFGDWLLTLRGGLSHELAEPHPPAKGKKRTDEEAAAIRKNRRIVLALSWLSVEDDRGAPSHLVRVANGTDADAARREKVVTALRAILTSRRVGEQGIESWVADCADSLSSRIREDAAWIDRSAAFDAARSEIGPSLTRDEVWDILEPFFASRESYLAQVELADDDSGEEEKTKDLVQKAGQWLSSRFGTGTGANFKSMDKVYAEMTGWAKSARPFQSGADALASLAKSLARFQPESADADGILALISGPGYKSATRNFVKAWGNRATAVTEDDLAKFAEVTAADQAKSEANVGGKGRRPWSDKILEKVESACGFTYIQKDGPARHSEFAVMLDHAARRVSIGHSWIKRAEAQRRNFEEDAKRLANVPNDAAEWLDAFVAERSGTSGATAAGGKYRIRRRAIEGWEEVVKKWKRASCKTEEDRIAAAREVQADPDIDKFGDIQLFEALAADDAVCVWRQEEKATPDPLRGYVLGHDAHFKQRRFKVPAYRHPDPLRHPVFGDFGNSRWDIEYAVHEAAKASRARRAPDESRAAWMKDRCGLRMGLWNGASLQDVALRWSSKRLSRDLALRPQMPDKPVHVVGRADRLGRAASGMKPDEMPIAAGLFEIADWNGRLQAPRAQLDAIAARIDETAGKWDEKARKLRDRIEWLVTFSAKLECRGPWYRYFEEQDNKTPFKKLVASGPRKGQTYESVNGWPHAILNDAREGHAKLILSHLPGLRVLSVDLGHRFAASCAVWEAISAEDMQKACRELGHRAPQASDLFIHLTSTVQKVRRKGRDKGKDVDVVETTVYRRVGEDNLRDPKTGKPSNTRHPAPWARLDRQFFIKLQGEEKPARAATNGKLKDGSLTETDEVEMVNRMASDLGLRWNDADEPTGRGVDELMRRAVRIATLGLKRHGRRAKIAYAFKPDCPGIPGIGGLLKAITRGDVDHVKFLTNALMDWHALATDIEWDGSAARRLWNEHVKPLQYGFEIGEPTPSDPDAERPTRQQRRKSAEELRDKLKPIAEHFARSGAESTRGIHDAWAKLWTEGDGFERTKVDFEHTLIRNENGKIIGSRTNPKPGKELPGGWHSRIRLLTDWIMPTGLRKRRGETDDECRLRRQRRAAAMNVGGLSLVRIATMRSLYQLHKAFAMRPRPDKVQGAPERGESNVGTAQSILDAMERMREQRVKQLASRIVEAALGVGVERDQAWDDKKKKWRYLKRPRCLLYHEDEHGVAHGDPRFKLCHAVVIENLRNYRPDELQTRRENKALMNWSAGKVRKYLEEACQLHGLHLREVMPNYTSRQCSRTGLPGLRCVDVSVDPETGEPKAYWWKKTLNAAMKKTSDGNHNEKKGDAEARFIVALADHLARLKSSSQSLPKTVSIPRRGGDLFVAAPPPACCADGHRPCPLCDGKRALQADLNAAANIGLRALLDPDFPGKWWYVPCDSATGKPAKDKCAGAAGLNLDEAILEPAKTKDKKGGAEKTRNREKTNAWRDVGSADAWRVHAAYWNDVNARVINRLRIAYGLD